MRWIAFQIFHLPVYLVTVNECSHAVATRGLFIADETAQKTNYEDECDPTPQDFEEYDDGPLTGITLAVVKRFSSGIWPVCSR